MKNLAKATIPVLLLFLGGCAHHAGYYSGYSAGGAYAVGVNNYTAYRSYPVYQDRPIRVHKTIVEKQRVPKQSFRQAYQERRNWHDHSYDKRRIGNRGADAKSNHQRNRDRLEPRYYAGRESAGGDFTDRRLPENRSANTTSRRPESGGRNRNQDRDDRYSGHDFYRDR